MLAQAKLDFQALMGSFNALMGATSVHSLQEKEALGTAVQKEFLPFLSLTDTADRFYAKPRGYAGDFLTIAKIYDDKPGGSGRLGPLVDACFLGTPAAAAVRNRRHLLRGLIGDVLDRHPRETTHVTSLACGPAQELFDVYATLDEPARLRTSLIDIDLQALAHVMDKATRHKVDRFMTVFNNNLLYLATGRQTIKLPPQDLIYSIGLIDYFGDKFVVQLLNFAHDHLKPGGSVVLGNFHPRNPNKAFMDHILDWKLIHRDEQDMHRLFGQSKFGKDADAIHFEQEGINLFAQCYKTDETR
jgi:SAM-dependent methyltransferase